MGSNMEIKGEIMHASTPNTTDPKGRINIPYGSNNKYRKIHPKLTYVYQYLLNVC